MGVDLPWGDREGGRGGGTVPFTSPHSRFSTVLALIPFEILRRNALSYLHLRRKDMRNSHAGAPEYFTLLLMICVHRVDFVSVECVCLSPSVCVWGGGGRKEEGGHA